MTNSLLKIKARLEQADSMDDCWQVWETLNQVCFDSELKRPDAILLVSDLSHLKSEVPGETTMGCVTPTLNNCVIHLRSDLSEQELYHVLGHEMIHQAILQKHGYEEMVNIAHGPKFTIYRNALKKFHGLTLK